MCKPCPVFYATTYRKHGCKKNWSFVSKAVPDGQTVRLIDWTSVDFPQDFTKGVKRF